ncbi:MAG: hypothetical protein P1U81_05445 [Verrucomicrobiales bacterium]|nr:hypothetical protein [Verrucomicrobiales bacterium]
MWKVLLVISSVVLLGAAWLSYTNMGTMQQRVLDADEQTQLLETRLKSLEETEMEVAQLEQSVQMLLDEAETLETEKIDLDTRVLKAQSDMKAQEALLAESSAKLEESRKLMGNIQKVEALQKEMLQIRTQIEEAEIEVTQAEGAVASAQVERDRLEKVAAELAALRTDQEAGVIRGQFQSRIDKAYNQWGFVIVSGGTDQGVVNRAQLDVYRRGQPICKLLVTSVEPGQSAADIIPGSLAPGQTVQVGDTVVSTVRVQTPAVVPAAAPAGGAAAPQPAAGTPAPAPAPAPDPFGGGMDAGGAPDPFGGGMDSGAAPDPFGGAPANPPADGAAAPDPFGGAPMAPADDTATPDPFQ